VSVVLNPPNSKGIWGMLNPNKTKNLQERPPVPVSTTWWLPNMILLDVSTPMGALKIFDVNIPIDEETTLVKFVALRSFFKGKWADRDARRRVFKVLYEDQAIVDEVRPELLPFDLSAELHVKSDYNAVKYRRRRQELIEMGWSVEGNTIVGEGPARVEARVIPSPIRKEVPELASAWNFKEVRSRQILDGEGTRERVTPRKERRLVMDDPKPEAPAETPAATAPAEPPEPAEPAVETPVDTAKDEKEVNA
jgi:hypothetical protein